MTPSHKRQKGSALIYILIAIALLGALTVTFMDSSSQQTSSQNSYSLVSDLKSQINLIRSSIDECVLLYASGDDALAGNAAVAGQNPVRPYPLQPNNTYVTGYTPASSRVENIRCPGNPGNSAAHVAIFGGSSGKSFPVTPLGGLIGYYNDIDGVWFYYLFNRTDSYITDALKKLDAQFSKCEAQYVDARTSLVHLTSNSAAGFACSSGYQCLRILVKATGTTIYPGETGCP